MDGNLPSRGGQAAAIVQANAGAGASVGGSVAVNTDGAQATVSKGRFGFGAGAQVSAGVQGSYVVAAPPLLPAIRGAVGRVTTFLGDLERGLRQRAVCTTANC